MADTKHKSIEQTTDDLKTDLSKLDWALLVQDKEGSLGAIDSLICRLTELAEVVEKTNFADATPQS
jgi:hypothetical protein